MADILKMYHPELNQVGDTTQEAFDNVYQFRGWEMLGPDEARASELVGRPVAKLDDLTNSEIRLVIADAGLVQPPQAATKDELLAALSITAPETTPAPEDEGGPFDPVDHTAEDVIAHLESANAGEVDRVVELEKSGKNRKTITGWTPA